MKRIQNWSMSQSKVIMKMSQRYIDDAGQAEEDDNEEEITGGPGKIHGKKKAQVDTSYNKSHYKTRNTQLILIIFLFYYHKFNER